MVSNVVAKNVKENTIIQKMVKRQVRNIINRKKVEKQGKNICSQKHVKGQIMKTSRGKVKRLSIDHNHETGKIRGLLCRKCNLMLESVEDVEFLRLAILYLEKYR